MGPDQVVGAFLLGVAATVFIYYTLWVIVLPFVDPKESSFHAFFPPRYYAIAIPSLLLVLFVTFVALFIGVTMLKSAAAQKQKQKRKQK